jgi:hypothetical protein
MNKAIIYILMLFMGILTACDPLEDRDTLTGAITADQLDISATPILVNGLRSNKIVLINHSPVSCEWDYGVGLSQKALDTVLMVIEGDNPIKFTGLNADGTFIEKTLSVNVEELSFEVPVQWGLLCGTGEKEWVWASSNCWGNGGYLINTAPAWWILSPGADLDAQVEGEGTADASMVFSIQGASLTKKRSDGTTVKGTFSFDMTKTTNNTGGEIWAIGKLKTAGVTVLVGVSPDEGKASVYEYDIHTLDEETLILSYAPAGSGEWGTAYYWVFKAK